MNTLFEFRERRGYTSLIMGDTIRKSLLDAIQRGDEISWYDFYETYRPLILLRGRDFNLNADELEELCQLVLIDIFKMGDKFKYDPAKGRFRDYLRRVISHNAIDLLRKRPKHRYIEKDDDVSLSDLPSDSWTEEWYNHILSQALSILRTQVEIVTYQAFELYALKQLPVKKVASFLNISPNMVYVAKSRAMQRLKSIIKKLKEES